MLSIIVFFAVCYYAYRHYSEIAFEFHKPRIGYGFLGIGIFIASYFIIAFLAGIIIAATNPEIIADRTIMMIVTFLLLALGVIAAVLFGKIFRKNWAANVPVNEILDQN